MPTSWRKFEELVAHIEQTLVGTAAVASQLKAQLF